MSIFSFQIFSQTRLGSCCLSDFSKELYENEINYYYFQNPGWGNKQLLPIVGRTVGAAFVTR